MKAQLAALVLSDDAADVSSPYQRHGYALGFFCEAHTNWP